MGSEVLGTGFAAAVTGKSRYRGSGTGFKGFLQDTGLIFGPIHIYTVALERVKNTRDALYSNTLDGN